MSSMDDMARAVLLGPAGQDGDAGNIASWQP
jgi:hypothetical protein